MIEVELPNQFSELYRAQGRMDLQWLLPFWLRFVWDVYTRGQFGAGMARGRTRRRRGGTVWLGMGGFGRGWRSFDDVDVYEFMYC